MNADDEFYQGPPVTPYAPTPAEAQRVLGNHYNRGARDLRATVHNARVATHNEGLRNVDHAYNVMAESNPIHRVLYSSMNGQEQSLIPPPEN